MTVDELVAALDLPASAHVGQRVPKKLLVENGAPTAADKRAINEGVEEIFWLSALKPTTVGVPAFRDSVREYPEIAVLRMRLRPGAKLPRLVELVHRAVPYPVLLFTDGANEGVHVSAAQIRWSLGEAGKTVLDGEVVSTSCQDEDRATPYWHDFLQSLAVGSQPRTTLYALYQGWLDTLLAIQAARISGVFAVIPEAERAAKRHAALRDYARLQTEAVRLHAAAAKESQIARRVDLNLELKRVEAALAEARTHL